MPTTDSATAERRSAARSRSSSPSAQEKTAVPRGRRPSDQGHRLNVLFSDELKTKLEELQRKTHAQTLSEVFRSSLVVYAHLLAAHENGEEFIIRGKDGKEKVLQVFL